MDVEKGISDSEERASNVIIDLLREQSEKHKDDNPLLVPSIGRIPDTIFRLIPKGTFRGHLIKLGPIHYDPYISSNDLKVRYMYDLFRRLKSPLDEIGTECVNMVHAKLDRIKACYDIADREFEDIRDKLGVGGCSYMMVVDACYILELIYKWSGNKKSKGDSLDVKYDLVRLDNQIPFFVLQDIFECTILKLEPTASLPILVLAFLKDIIPFESKYIVIDDDDDDDDTNKYKHILDLLYQCYKPKDASSSDLLSHVTTMFSATELAKAGVKFIPNQDKKCKTEMKFRSSWGNATLTMTPMRIEESTAPVLCNLAAYERVCPEVGNYITSYVFAMKMLLDTKEDVLKLVESKICRNPTGHQYTVDLIHGLCKDLALTEFLYAKEWQKMGKFCNSRLGWMRRTYFSGGMELHCINFCINPLHSYSHSNLLFYSYSLTQNLIYS